MRQHYLFPDLALVVGSFLSGAMMSLSFITIPVILNTSLPAAQLCSIWAQIYVRGRALLPALAGTTSALYAYTYARRTTLKSSRVLIFAGLMTIAIAPFTWIVLAPTNNKLFALQAKSQTIATDLSDDKLARDLIAKWNKLHFSRSILPLFGAVMALFFK